MENLDHLVGEKFGRLTITGDAGIRSNGSYYKRYLIAKCECGTVKEYWWPALRNGNTRSCKCLQKQAKSHGLSKSKIYRVWKSMKARCYNKSEKVYKHYGGRGIIICTKWKKDFSVFHEWALANGYKLGLTIDREDNNGNYCPENCRWITQKRNLNNKRTSRFITYNGERKTTAEWADQMNVCWKTAKNRFVKLGIKPEQEMPLINH